MQKLIQDWLLHIGTGIILKPILSKNYLDSCLILADKALSYDDQLDEAYFIKGEYYRVNGQSDEALFNYDRALEINPNYYSAYYRKGYLLTWVSV